MKVTLMTKLKIEAVTYLVLRILTYLIVFASFIGILAAAGGLETDMITFSQFFLYEFISTVLIGLAISVYYIGVAIKADFRKNYEKMKKLIGKGPALTNN